MSGLAELRDDLKQRANSCRELKAKATFIRDQDRLAGQIVAYEHTSRLISALLAQSPSPAEGAEGC